MPELHHQERHLSAMLADLLPSQGSVVRIAALDGFNRSGVYFLYRSSVVVYVGQATDVRRRIGDHIGEGVKRFDSASFIPCPRGELLSLERQYIELLRPEYNRSCNPALLDASYGEQRMERPFIQAYFTPQEAAEYLGVDQTRLDEMKAAGTLRPCRVSRARERRYRGSDLYALAEDGAIAQRNERDRHKFPS